MREIIQIVEGPKSNLKTIRLPAGTPVYHGTNTAGDFAIPDGPAWFGLDRATGERWAGWSEAPPEGRTIGEKRVLVCKTTVDLDLVDTRSYEDWERLCDRLNVEETTYAAAEGVVQAGLPGWYGEKEIMISFPEKVLVSKSA